MVCTRSTLDWSAGCYSTCCCDTNWSFTACLIACLLACTAFVYYVLGLERWEAARADWLHHKHRNNNSDTDSTARAAVPIEVDEIIDVIFSPRWRGGAHNEEGPPRCFPQSVPLPQMVDILVDLWEAEGLDT